MSFIRRYTTDPGDAELTKIEGVVVIDRDPPGAVSGTSTSLVTVLAEFEDGPFNTPTELMSGNDLITYFGGFGFSYDGTVSNNPAARSRKADGALKPEYWNGNGWVALSNKRFRRLAVVRVDTSVGSVQFTRRASLKGNGKYAWDLEPGQTVVLDIGAGAVTSTFAAAAAVKTSAAQTFPTTFVGGEQMTIVIDEGTPNQIGPVTVAFLSTDSTQAACITRINTALGFTCAASSSSTVMTLTGRQRGTGGSVRVVSQDTVVGTALAFNTTAQAGTGDAANIDAVTFAEVKTTIEADIAGVTVERTPAGYLRISANSAPSIQVTAASTALDFGLGTVGTTYTAALGNDGYLPAGTRVRNGSAVEWVTCESILIDDINPGPYTVKVRPALDDGSVLGSVAGSVTVMPFAVELDAFAVVNPLPLAAALTESQIDAQYIAAAAATLDQNSIVRETNVIVSARQSNAIRQELRTNAITASNNGLFGRMTIVRPPLNTPRAIARSSTQQPGVGTLRTDRLHYNYPGVRTFIREIALRGTGGGAGFSSDGLIDVGGDTFAASIFSNINPEQNPGELTQYTSGIIGLEAGNADIKSMTMEDYIAFKAAGIGAWFMEDGVATIESGVTAVNPVAQPQLVNVSRRRMADFIQDSLSNRLKSFAKKVSTRERRSEAYGEVKAFLEGLKSTVQPSNQRIDDYSIDAKKGNTPTSLAKGIFRLIIRVRTLSTMDVIVLDTTIGEFVIVETLAEAA